LRLSRGRGVFGCAFRGGEAGQAWLECGCVNEESCAVHRAAAGSVSVHGGDGGREWCASALAVSSVAPYAMPDAALAAFFGGSQGESARSGSGVRAVASDGGGVGSCECRESYDGEFSSGGGTERVGVREKDCKVGDSSSISGIAPDVGSERAARSEVGGSSNASVGEVGQQVAGSRANVGRTSGAGDAGPWRGKSLSARKDAEHGKNWERNCVWRAQKKQKKNNRKVRQEDECAARGSSAVWSGMSVEQRDVVVASRVQRMVEDNKLASERARVNLQKLRDDQAAGVFTRRTEVESKLLQGQLDGTYSPVVGGRLKGWAATLQSGSGGSSSPSASAKTGVVGSTVASTVSVASVAVEESEKRIEAVRMEYVDKVVALQAEVDFAQITIQRYERQLNIVEDKNGIKRQTHNPGAIPWHVDETRVRVKEGAGPFQQMTRYEEVQLERAERDAKERSDRENRRGPGYSQWSVD